MYGLLLVLHLLVCLALVGVVLVQSGKGGGLAGGAFGGTAQTVFGGRGATDFITRATMVLGATFFATSLLLALISSNTGRARSLLQEEAKRAAPVAPGPAPAQVPSGTPRGGVPPAGNLVPSATPAGGSAPAPAAPAPAAPAKPAPAGAGGTKPPGGGP
jgi:preprotein translocase subunit SecG